MKNKSIIKSLNYIISIRKLINITVYGKSMSPTLVEKDVVCISKNEEYHIGDILVFDYKEEGLLVHRLLAIRDGYICKGDNAFRLEKINHQCILGKVIAVNGAGIEKWSLWKCILSYRIGNIFSKNKNITAVKKTLAYKFYSLVVLKNNK